MVLQPNIDMTLAVKAKEQYLVGLYATSLDTFREVQRQIQSHITALEHELEHGDPAGASRKAVEDAYEEWTKCLGMLQEEFGIVQMLQEAGQAFKIAPGANAGEKSSAAFAAPGLTDAQLQAQHLAKQASTDIRDPDVWPPPTTEAPVRPTKARQSSAGFVPSQWAAAAPAAQPASAARAPLGSNVRTPMKGPVPSASADDDAAAQPSNRLPAWASNPAPAPASKSAVPAARPRFVRKPSEPPAAVVAPAAAAPAAAAPKAKVPPRKPAVPTGGRKSVAPTKHKKDDSTAASSSTAAAPEDGSRIKYEAASKEEQEMAEMIEREILDKRPNVKMDDIAGLAGAKQLLQEAVVLPRLIPGYFTGKRKPWRGVLMFGPPGTGKTLLAKAVATECNTTFFNVSPSTVTSKYRGDSEKLMKLLFEMARFYAPSTIFMDEVDGLCSARGGGGEHEASRRVKGEILQQMDGATTGDYDPAKSVIVLGATNLPWELDSAFLRRFEKRVHIDLPDAVGRAEMFKINTEGMEVSEDCKGEDGKWTPLVEMSEGYSGADIAVVCNDASMLGLRRLLAGKSNAEVAKLNKDDFKQPITLADFQSVFATVKSSAGKNDLEKYREWMKEFGSAI